MPFSRFDGIDHYGGIYIRTRSAIQGIVSFLFALTPIEPVATDAQGSDRIDRGLWTMNHTAISSDTWLADEKFLTGHLPVLSDSLSGRTAI
jgi:hypothetical protein